MSTNLTLKTECESYSEGDGYTKEIYTIEIEVESGCVKIRQDILCGLIGKSLFSVPCIEKNYGIPIPDYMLQIARMMLETNEFSTQPRHRSSAIDKFIQWFDSSMQQISKEKKEAQKEIESLEKEIEEDHKNHMRWMNTNTELLKMIATKYEL